MDCGPVPQTRHLCDRWPMIEGSMSIDFPQPLFGYLLSSPCSCQTSGQIFDTNLETFDTIMIGLFLPGESCVTSGTSLLSLQIEFTHRNVTIKVRQGSSPVTAFKLAANVHTIQQVLEVVTNDSHGSDSGSIVRTSVVVIGRPFANTLRTVDMTTRDLNGILKDIETNGTKEFTVHFLLEPLFVVTHGCNYYLER